MTTRTRILTVGLTGAIFAILLGASSCNSPAKDKAQQARDKKAATVKLCTDPGASLECKNLAKRLDRYDNPSKISYIYLLADTGGIYAYFTVKGKVSSNLSQMGPMDQIIDCTDGSGCSDVIVEAPGDDGSYGPNEDGVFFFTSDDVLVTWNGRYLLVDAPLRINEAGLVLPYVDGSKPTD